MLREALRKECGRIVAAGVPPAGWSFLDTLIRESIPLAVDLETTDRYAQVRDELRRSGTPIPENDVWIAALARQYEEPVVSRDEHFDAVKGIVRHSW